jgi:argininosuccinate synthase
MKRIVLGFTGDAPTAAAIGWLAERYSAEIVTLTLDCGQGDELAGTREKALALGAVRAHVIDAREELVRDYLLPAMQAGALDAGYALAYPLLAKRLVELARMEGAFAIAHCAGSQALGAAIGSEAAALDPGLEVIAPLTMWSVSAQDLAALARRHGLPAVSANESRIEATLWGRRIVAPGVAALDSQLFTLTRDAADCPSDPALVDVRFAAGVPVGANDIEMSMLELMESLETIAGAHGIGRVVSESTASEAPAARVLSAAYEALEQHVLGADLAGFKRRLAAVYSSALVGGHWFSDLREGIDAFARTTRTRVTGNVRLRLCGGECEVVSCDAPEPAAATSTPPNSSRAVA